MIPLTLADVAAVVGGRLHNATGTEITGIWTAGTRTGATDAIYLTRAGIPTYGVSGIFNDEDAHRSQGVNGRPGIPGECQDPSPTCSQEEPCGSGTGRSQ